MFGYRRFHCIPLPSQKSNPQQRTFLSTAPAAQRSSSPSDQIANSTILLRRPLSLSHRDPADIQKIEGQSLSQLPMHLIDHIKERAACVDPLNRPNHNSINLHWRIAQAPCRLPRPAAPSWCPEAMPDDAVRSACTGRSTTSPFR